MTKGVEEQAVYDFANRKQKNVQNAECDKGSALGDCKGVGMAIVPILRIKGMRRNCAQRCKNSSLHFDVH